MNIQKLWLHMRALRFLISSFIHFSQHHFIAIQMYEIQCLLKYLRILLFIDTPLVKIWLFSIRQPTLNDKHSYSYHSRGKILFSYLVMHHHGHCWDQHWWCVSQTIEENHRHQSQYIKRGIIIVVINIIIDADLRCFDCSYSFG